jgi:hypothetical protein
MAERVETFTRREEPISLREVDVQILSTVLRESVSRATPAAPPEGLPVLGPLFSPHPRFDDAPTDLPLGDSHEHSGCSTNPHSM